MLAYRFLHLWYLNPVLILVVFAIFRPVQDIITPIAMNELQNKNPMILLSYLLHALRRLVTPPSYKPTLLAYLLYWWWLKDTFLHHLGCPFSSLSFGRCRESFLW